MKSDDYKAGVRDMAEAIRENFPGRRWPVTHQIIDGAEQRLLAYPVPKFSVGQVVRNVQLGMFVKIIERTHRGYIHGGNTTIWHEDAFEALTPLEATGKE